MKPKSYYTVADKKVYWGDGPWVEEPDKVQWEDETTKLPCLAVRNALGAWCGYVGVFKDHPYYEVPYTQIDLEVHGGLTFSDKCDSSSCEETSICHIPDEGESDDVWWLGFDCGHAGDLCPKFNSDFKFLIEYQSYKTLNYVKKECTSLASQLCEVR